MYPKNLQRANARLSDTTTTTATATSTIATATAPTATTTKKIEEQGQQQPIHWNPQVKEEEKEESPVFKKPQKRVSFDLIPFYINSDSTTSSMSTTETAAATMKQGKENIAAFHEMLGKRKRTCLSPVKGAGISKNTNNSRHRHRHQRRLQHYRRRFNNYLRQNDNNTTDSHQPCRLILKGPKEPNYRVVKFKFEGRIIRSVDTEIPTY